jgi:hypothetical protein
MKLTLASELVLDALIMAVWQRRPSNQILIHCDQGSQYGSDERLRFVKAPNLEPSMGASTYMIILSHQLYEKVAPWLQIFECRRPPCVGAGRYGAGVVQALRERSCRVVTVDYNPELVRAGSATDHQVLYGDAEVPEFLALLPLARAHWVVSTIREEPVSRSLIHGLRVSGYAGQVAVTAHSSAEAARLEQSGADLALLPFAEAARRAADRLLGKQRDIVA